MSGQPAPDQFHGAILRTRRGGVNAPNGLPAWRPVRLRWCQWLCPMGAPMAKNTRPGERAWATVRRTGGDYPWEVTLLPLVVNGCQAGSVVSPGYVRRSEDRLCEMFHGGFPGRLRNSRSLKPHSGRTDFPEFLPIWGRTFPYHGSVAGGQLRQTCSGDETVQSVRPRQPQQRRNFTNRLGFQFGGISEQPGLIRFRGQWTTGTGAVETGASNRILRRGNSWVRGLSGETGDLGSPPQEFRCLRLCCVCPRRLRRGAAHWMRPGPDAQWNSGLVPGKWEGR